MENIVKPEDIRKKEAYNVEIKKDIEKLVSFINNELKTKESIPKEGIRIKRECTYYMNGHSHFPNNDVLHGAANIFKDNGWSCTFNNSTGVDMEATEYYNECNVTFAENQPEYLPLPALKTDDGTVVSCWKLSFFERVKVLFTGKIWLALLTFNRGLSPQFLTVNKSDLIKLPTNEAEEIYNLIKIEEGGYE
jgi:hypothetical protein